MKRAYALPALAVFLLSAPAALAQGGATVQATPPAMAVERLNSNLTRLSRAPTDVDALVGAGMAAYELGDAQAANGFFMRADMVNPRIGRVKLGLALVALQLKQPRDAADNFDAAAQLGEPASAYLAERGLAYDLVGQPDKAQRDYAMALRTRPGDTAIIRNHALSLGASGKLAEAEVMLRPLLFRSDRAAWRDRAMILAMNGRTAEARRIAQAVMPRPLAESMDPYLQRMGALTPAQKVAAARYGQFPADGLRLAPVTSSPAQAARLPEVERRKKKKKGRDNAEIAQAVPQDDSSLIAAMPRDDVPAPVVQPTPAYRSTPVAPARRDARDDDPDGWSAAERSLRAQSQRTAPRSAQPPAPVQLRPDRRVARPVMGPPAPTPTLAPAVQVAPTPATPPPAPSAAPAAPAPQPRSLAAIMADIAVPESERQSSTPAVDLAEVARIRAERRKAEAAVAAKAAAEKAKKEAAVKAKAEAAARAKAEAEEKARIKANPARYWVQVATGRDVAALAFDLRRLRKTYAALAERDGWTAEWGATRRLLVGPFTTTAKAKVVETDLRKAGTDSFIWQSEAGEVVTALSRK